MKEGRREKERQNLLYNPMWSRYSRYSSCLFMSPYDSTLSLLSSLWTLGGMTAASWTALAGVNSFFVLPCILPGSTYCLWLAGRRQCLCHHRQRISDQWQANYYATYPTPGGRQKQTASSLPTGDDRQGERRQAGCGLPCPAGCVSQAATLPMTFPPTCACSPSLLWWRVISEPAAVAWRGGAYAWQHTTYNFPSRHESLLSGRGHLMLGISPSLTRDSASRLNLGARLLMPVEKIVAAASYYTDASFLPNHPSTHYRKAPPRPPSYFPPVAVACLPNNVLHSSITPMAAYLACLPTMLMTILNALIPHPYPLPPPFISSMHMCQTIWHGSTVACMLLCAAVACNMAHLPHRGSVSVLAFFFYLPALPLACSFLPSLTLTLPLPTWQHMYLLNIF